MGAGGGVESAGWFSGAVGEEASNCRFSSRCTLVRLGQSNENYLLNIKINNIPLCKHMLPVFAVCSGVPCHRG
jgi:hypothetical protein